MQEINLTEKQYRTFSTSIRKIINTISNKVINTTNQESTNKDLLLIINQQAQNLLDIINKKLGKKQNPYLTIINLNLKKLIANITLLYNPNANSDEKNTILFKNALTRLYTILYTLSQMPITKSGPYGKENYVLNIELKQFVTSLNNYWYKSYSSLFNIKNINKFFFLNDLLFRDDIQRSQTEMARVAKLDANAALAEAVAVVSKSAPPDIETFIEVKAISDTDLPTESKDSNYAKFPTPEMIAPSKPIPSTRRLIDPGSEYGEIPHIIQRNYRSVRKTDLFRLRSNYAAIPSPLQEISPEDAEKYVEKFCMDFETVLTELERELNSHNHSTLEKISDKRLPLIAKFAELNNINGFYQRCLAKIDNKAKQNEHVEKTKFINQRYKEINSKINQAIAAANNYKEIPEFQPEASEPTSSPSIPESTERFRSITAPTPKPAPTATDLSTKIRRNSAILTSAKKEERKKTPNFKKLKRKFTKFKKNKAHSEIPKSSESSILSPEITSDFQQHIEMANKEIKKADSYFNSQRIDISNDSLRVDLIVTENCIYAAHEQLKQAEAQIRTLDEKEIFANAQKTIFRVENKLTSFKKQHLSKYIESRVTDQIIEKTTFDDLLKNIFVFSALDNKTTTIELSRLKSQLDDIQSSPLSEEKLNNLRQLSKDLNKEIFYRKYLRYPEVETLKLFYQRFYYLFDGLYGLYSNDDMPNSYRSFKNIEKLDRLFSDINTETREDILDLDITSLLASFNIDSNLTEANFVMFLGYLLYQQQESANQAASLRLQTQTLINETEAKLSSKSATTIRRQSTAITNSELSTAVDTAAQQSKTLVSTLRSKHKFQPKTSTPATQEQEKDPTEKLLELIDKDNNNHLQAMSAIKELKQAIEQNSSILEINNKVHKINQALDLLYAAQTNMEDENYEFIPLALAAQFSNQTPESLFIDHFETITTYIKDIEAKKQELVKQIKHIDSRGYDDVITNAIELVDNFLIFIANKIIALKEELQAVEKAASPQSSYDIIERKLLALQEYMEKAADYQAAKLTLEENSATSPVVTLRENENIFLVAKLSEIATREELAFKELETLTASVEEHQKDQPISVLSKTSEPKITLPATEVHNPDKKPDVIETQTNPTSNANDSKNDHTTRFSADSNQVLPLIGRGSEPPQQNTVNITVTSLPTNQANQLAESMLTESEYNTQQASAHYKLAELEEFIQNNAATSFLLAGRVALRIALGIVGIELVAPIAFEMFGKESADALAQAQSDELFNNFQSHDYEDFLTIKYLADSGFLQEIYENIEMARYGAISPYFSSSAADLSLLIRTKRAVNFSAANLRTANINRTWVSWYFAANYNNTNEAYKEAIKTIVASSRLLTNRGCEQIATIITGIAGGCPEHTPEQWQQTQVNYSQQLTPTLAVARNVKAALELTENAISKLIAIATPEQALQHGCQFLIALANVPSTTETYKALNKLNASNTDEANAILKKKNNNEDIIEFIQAQYIDIQTTCVLVVHALFQLADSLKQEPIEILKNLYTPERSDNNEAFYKVVSALIYIDKRTINDERKYQAILSLAGKAIAIPKQKIKNPSPKKQKQIHQEQQNTLINIYEQARTTSTQGDLTYRTKMIDMFEATAVTVSNNNPFAAQVAVTAVIDQVQELAAILMTPRDIPGHNTDKMSNLEKFKYHGKQIATQAFAPIIAPFVLIKNAADGIRKMYAEVKGRPYFSEPDLDDLYRKPLKILLANLAALDEWSFINKDKYPNLYPASIALLERFKAQVNDTNPVLRMNARRFVNRIFPHYTLGVLHNAENASHIELGKAIFTLIEQETVKLKNSLGNKSSELNQKLTENLAYKFQATLNKTIAKVATANVDEKIKRAKTIMLQYLRGFAVLKDTIIQEKKLSPLPWKATLKRERLNSAEKQAALAGLITAYLQVIPEANRNQAAIDLYKTAEQIFTHKTAKDHLNNLNPNHIGSDYHPQFFKNIFKPAINAVVPELQIQLLLQDIISNPNKSDNYYTLATTLIQNWEKTTDFDEKLTKLKTAIDENSEPTTLASKTALAVKALLMEWQRAKKIQFDNNNNPQFGQLKPDDINLLKALIKQVNPKDNDAAIMRVFHAAVQSFDDNLFLLFKQLITTHLIPSSGATDNPPLPLPTIKPIKSSDLASYNITQPVVPKIANELEQLTNLLEDNSFVHNKTTLFNSISPTSNKIRSKLQTLYTIYSKYAFNADKHPFQTMLESLLKNVRATSNFATKYMRKLFEAILSGEWNNNNHAKEITVCLLKAYQTLSAGSNTITNLNQSIFDRFNRRTSDAYAHFKEACERADIKITDLSQQTITEKTPLIAQP